MTPETHSQLASFIWSICNLLRGPYKRNEYRKVILPMTVLRRFDCVLAPTKAAVLEAYAQVADRPEGVVEAKLRGVSGWPFYNVSRLDFERLLDDPDQLAPNLNAYINAFSSDVRKIMERFSFDQQITRLQENNLLYEVVKAFAKLDLSGERIDSVQMGYVFEELIRIGSEQANEEAGEHFTPREVIKLMVNLLLSPEEDLATPAVVKMIYDPACGTGGMLSVAEAYIRELNQDATPMLYGQDWYREFARSYGEQPLELVGSASLGDDVVATAERIRAALHFDLSERRQTPTWTEALRRCIGQADDAGVLVMVSGVVGSNNRRPLNPQEFRGFALADGLAPVVFINGADSKAAQMFTLAHELAHIWLGQSALSDAQALTTPDEATERWCNQVAAEVLAPLHDIRAASDTRAELRHELDRLARRFKVSTLVILRRLHDAGRLSSAELWAAYEEELERLRSLPKGSGGSFYLTLGARVSKRFGRAVVMSALEGRTAFTESFRLLGIKKMATFREVGHSLGVGF